MKDINPIPFWILEPNSATKLKKQLLTSVSLPAMLVYKIDMSTLGEDKRI